MSALQKCGNARECSWSDHGKFAIFPQLDGVENVRNLQTCIASQAYDEGSIPFTRSTAISRFSSKSKSVAAVKVRQSARKEALPVLRDKPFHAKIARLNALQGEVS